MLTHGSLFTGVGGFDLGFEASDIQTLWQCEIDPHCQKLLQKRWPLSTIHGDIRKTDIARIEPVDIISFGSPCQGFSLAGSRQGARDSRSGLLHDALTVVAHVKPQFAVWENVPDLLTSGDGHDFGAALTALVAAGALDIAWRVFDATEFGLPQSRERLILIADFRAERAGQILAQPAPVLSSHQDFAAAWDFTFLTIRGRRGGQRAEQISNVSPCLRTAAGGSSHAYYCDPAWGCAPRRLTPLECERLMGFPDNWTKGFSDTTRYTMLGNAVCVPLTRWIGERLGEALKIAA